MSREAFEAWVKADSNLPVDRDAHGYADMTTALMWHAWQAAQKANAPVGALGGESDAKAGLGLAGINSNCAHNFTLDHAGSIRICIHCRLSEIAAHSRRPTQFRPHK